MAKEVGFLEVIEEVRASSMEEQDKTVKVKKGVDKLVGIFGDFFDLQKQARLDALEDKREQGKGGKEKEGKLGSDGKEKKSWLWIVGAILGAVAGLAIGIVEGFAKAALLITKGLRFLFKPLLKGTLAVIRGIIKLYVALFRGIGKGFAKIFPKFTAQMARLVDTVKDAFKGFQGKNAKRLTAALKYIGSIPKRISLLVAGIGASFRMGMNGLNGGVRSIRGSFRKLNFVEKMAKGLGKGIAAIGRGFRTIQNGIKSLFAPIRGFDKIMGPLAKSADAATGATKGTGRMAKIMGSITKAVKGIKGVLGSMGSGFSKMFPLFRTIGRVIFFPLTIVMTIIDAFKGFKEGFASSGGSIIGGVLGAISGILVGLIGMPLDLLKGIVGWIAGKFGMEGVQEFLAGFSFSDMIKGLFHSITDRVLGLFDAMKDETGKFDFGKIVMTILGVFVNTITAPFRLMLEGLAVLAAKIPVKGKDIAAGIRAFADNITMDTGQGETEDRKADREQYNTNTKENNRVAKLADKQAARREQMQQGSERMSQSRGGGGGVTVNAPNVDNSQSSGGSQTTMVGDATGARDNSAGTSRITA